jgi:hypothetical protein
LNECSESNKGPLDFRTPGMMEGNFPEEFLLSLGMKKAVIDESFLIPANKIGRIVPHPDGPIGLRLLEKYFMKQEEQDKPDISEFKE